MCFMPYPTKPKGGWQRRGQPEHSAAMGKEGHTEVCEQIPGHLSEQYGRGTQRT